MVSNSFVGTSYRVTLVGELSYRNLDCLGDELTKMETSGAIHTTVDVSGLNFIDSVGMNALARPATASSRTTDTCASTVGRDSSAIAVPGADRRGATRHLVRRDTMDL